MSDANTQRVQITDTILRDAHQSLLATRMRTADMLPICQRLDQIGFWSLEVWGGATFDACLRYLDDHRILVEPSCGASLAALYRPHPFLQNKRCILVIVCGGAGVTIEQLQQWQVQLK